MLACLFGFKVSLTLPQRGSHAERAASPAAWERRAVPLLEALRDAGYRPAVYHGLRQPAYVVESGVPVRLGDPFDPFQLFPADTPTDRRWVRARRQCAAQAAVPRDARQSAAAAGFCAAAGGSLPPRSCIALHPCAGWVPLAGAQRSGPGCRLLIVARGEAWSSSRHVDWPDAFKAAVRCLLLAANTKAGTAQDSAAQQRVDRRRRGKAPRLSAPAGAGSASLASLPQELLLKIVELAAAPMSEWL